MIVKKRKVPFILKQEEALLRRIPPRHPKKALITSSINKRKAGFWGEEEVDYPLSHLEYDQYRIFHDLRLIHDNKAFQMDTLLLTPYFALILEVKNISGVIEFDPTFNQLIRRTENQEERLPNPTIQVRRQRRQLSNWLKSRSISLPIKCLVVMTHPSAVMKTTSQNPQEHMITHVEDLFEKIRELEKASPNMISFPKHSDKLIMEGHTPLAAKNILETYNVSFQDLRKGVQCSRCSSYEVIWYKKRWRCSSCQFYSSDAHKKAIEDYFLLGFPSITNATFREFTLLDNTQAAKNFLSHLNLPKTGHKRSTLYHSPFFKDEDTSLQLWES